MLYHFYEWNHAALVPLRAAADATKLFYDNPLNPLSHLPVGRSMAAAAELFERVTRVYGKPEFGLHETVVDGQRIPVQDKSVWQKPFGRLLHFERELPKRHGKDPRFLVVAPMSGHYATLLRGTVEALLPYADVYITDWRDARKVPLADGRFDLDDYVDYLIEMLQFLGPDTHVIGVCQPAVPVMMAVARMEADGDDCAPATMTLMGGPIDTRINPTSVNQLAEEKGIDWFRESVVMTVPFPQPGVMRSVYPGFLQLTGFMSMNLDRHVTAHKDFFWHLVKDDGDSADKHREFYDEYNAVMDLTAEFYLQTVDEVFIKHSLPKGEMMHRGKRIDLTKIRRTALLTVEGENDDISGVGQTEAAQHLCVNIPDDKRIHYVQPKVGHYGVFNGSRFRAEICPRIVDFALTHGATHSAASLPKRAQPAKGTGTPHREGAVAEREAKAEILGKDATRAGETVLAGAVISGADVAKAATAAAQAAMTPTPVKAAETPAAAKSAAAATTTAKATETKPAAKSPPARKPVARKPVARKAAAKPAAKTARAEAKPAKAPARAKTRAAANDQPAKTAKSAPATSARSANAAKPAGATPAAKPADAAKPAQAATASASATASEPKSAPASTTAAKPGNSGNRQS
ncbi:polyhydroxyalkanoate depolymerase [Aurantimonas sp. A2-1-M11]|uniref:polyhydroxyalkanoate depolymerase n=1 Tax=Aurantimonas sp. A2-1-M11 TaxID=3113712 RepID=UPI002F954ACB